MKQPLVFAGMIGLFLSFAGGLALSTAAVPTVYAESSVFRCSDSALIFPAKGIAGWKYQDPASTDFDASGHRTVHTGLDIYVDEGEGGPIYAPADGFVSRGPGGESFNIVLPGVVNLLTGEKGIELYFTHVAHDLVAQQTFKAGEVIATQLGDHLHFSIGAFIGYDDREIEQTQDVSPYFGAVLAYDPAFIERFDVSHWCTTAPAASTGPALVSTKVAAPTELSIASQECLPDGLVRIILAPKAVKAGDWVDLSIFYNDFAADYIGVKAISSYVQWDGLEPGTPHFIRVNRPMGAGWSASPTLPFLTRNDC